MSALKKAGVVAAAIGLSTLGALHGPSQAAPSATGAVLKCPSFCVDLGPVTGSNVVPNLLANVSWTGQWTQPSTSNTTPTTPVVTVNLTASGVHTTSGFTGAGTMYTYRWEYTDMEDNDYSTMPVSVSITDDIVQITSVAGDVRIVGANSSSGFKGVGYRLQTG